MSKKILIFGATGAVGSALANLLKSDSIEAHLIGKNEEEISRLSDETGFKCSVADVLEENFVEKVHKDIEGDDISGVAYCVGSINFKPIIFNYKKGYVRLLFLKFYFLSPIL
jgi:NADPH:quinone reductase and related Zn-dependent oxidoreductases